MVALASTFQTNPCGIEATEHMLFCTKGNVPDEPLWD